MVHHPLLPISSAFMVENGSDEREKTHQNASKFETHFNGLSLRSGRFYTSTAWTCQR